MQDAPIPADDHTRRAVLNSLNVLYMPAEDRFDPITRLARRVLDVPIALISLKTRDINKVVYDAKNAGKVCPGFKHKPGV